MCMVMTTWCVVMITLVCGNDPIFCVIMIKMVCGKDPIAYVYGNDPLVCGNDHIGVW